jgi:hypothetical protein
MQSTVPRARVPRGRTARSATKAAEINGALSLRTLRAVTGARKSVRLQDKPEKCAIERSLCVGHHQPLCPCAGAVWDSSGGRPLSQRRGDGASHGARKVVDLQGKERQCAEEAALCARERAVSPAPPKALFVRRSRLQSLFRPCPRSQERTVSSEPRWAPAFPAPTISVISRQL